MSPRYFGVTEAADSSGPVRTAVNGTVVARPVSTTAIY
jgi:hypothetical protein